MSYKKNEGKPKWRLIDFQSLEEVVRVFEFGEAKYGTHAYQHMDIERDDILDSMQRHLVSLYNHQDQDPETGLNHAAHLAANCLMFLWKYSNYESRSQQSID